MSEYSEWLTYSYSRLFSDHNTHATHTHDILKDDLLTLLILTRFENCSTHTHSCSLTLFFEWTHDFLLMLWAWVSQKLSRIFDCYHANDLLSGLPLDNQALGASALGWWASYRVSSGVGRSHSQLWMQFTILWIPFTILWMPFTKFFNKLRTGMRSAPCVREDLGLNNKYFY